MAIVDLNDPCAVCLALRQAQLDIALGGRETLIRYRGPEGEREVRYEKGDGTKLQELLRQAQIACDQKNGVISSSRRFAIRGGAQQIGPGGWWDIGTGQYRP